MADPALLQALVLGIVEGLTEFLPISSTGHLLIAEAWLGRRSDLFNVAIQAGAILAVVLIYWRRLWDLTVRLAQAENRDYLGKLMLAFALTVAGGFAARKAGIGLPETVAPVAWALVLGGLAIFAIEWRVARYPGNARITRKKMTVPICVPVFTLLMIVAAMSPDPLSSRMRALPTRMRTQASPAAAA